MFIIYLHSERIKKCYPPLYHFAQPSRTLTNHLGHFASLKNHLLVAQVLILNDNLHERLSVKTYVSLVLKTRREKKEEKMKKKRKRKEKKTLLCSKQCRRVGPEQKTFHTQKENPQSPSNTKKTHKNGFWLLFFYWLVWFIFLGWVGFGFETPTANPDVTLPSLKSIINEDKVEIRGFTTRGHTARTYVSWHVFADFGTRCFARKWHIIMHLQGIMTQSAIIEMS